MLRGICLAYFLLRFLHGMLQLLQNCAHGGILPVQIALQFFAVKSEHFFLGIAGKFFLVIKRWNLCTKWIFKRDFSHLSLISMGVFGPEKSENTARSELRKDRCNSKQAGVFNVPRAFCWKQ